MKQFQVVLRLHRRGLIGWSVGVGGYLLIMGLAYVAFGGAEALEELAKSYPEEILGAFTEDIASISGFLEAEAGTFLPLVFGIYLITAATKHFAGAEETGAIDHLLARPISRDAYYWHVLLGTLLGFAFIVIAGVAGGVIGFATEASAREMAGIAGMMVEHFVLGTVFLGLGGLLGALFHHRSQATGVGAAIVVVWFVLDFLSRLSEDTAWMAYLSPMGYRSRSDLFHGDPDPLFLLVSIALAAATSLAGWRVFQRKSL